jgi:hypothetical protein
VKAYIFVDVDGVLNAFPPGRMPEGWKTASVELGPGAVYPITYNPAIGEKLIRLAKDHGAELVWCTTWQEQASEHIAPLVGLPAMPFVPLVPPRFRASLGWIKAHSIGRWMEQAGDRRPFVWFDDEPDAADWAERECRQVPRLVVQCDEERGLRKRELEVAGKWLSALS